MESSNIRLLTDAKNAVRGTVGNKHIPLYRVTTEAIDALPLRDIPEFVEWLHRFPISNERILPPQIITSYKELWPNTCVLPTDHSKALNWVACLSSLNYEQIEKFLEHRARWEDYVLRGQGGLALEALDAIEQCSGLSLWLINARISTLQRFRGLEAQKLYTKQIHLAAPGLVPAFVAHFVSQRNEEGIRFERFASGVRKEVGKQPVDDTLKEFLTIHLTQSGDEITDAATIVRHAAIAASVSRVDAYEYSIWATERLVTLAASSGRVFDKESTGKLLAHQNVRVSSDWREKKWVSWANNDISSIEIQPTAAADAYVVGDFLNARRLAAERIADTPDDLETHLVYAKAIAQGRLEIGATLSRFQRDIIVLFSSLRTEGNDVARIKDEITKIAANFSGHRTACALRHWLNRELSTTIGPGTTVALFLSSPRLDIEHCLAFTPTVAHRVLNGIERNSGISCASRLLRSMIDGTEPEASIHADVRLEALVCASLWKGDIEAALDNSEAMARSKSSNTRRCAARYEIGCLIKLRRDDDVLRRIAYYCCEDSELRTQLPIESTLRGRRWSDLAHLRKDISLPIALDLFCRATNTFEQTTNRRIAYDEFLRANHIDHPSDLVSQTTHYLKSQLVYFLTYVCVPEIMDVSFDVYETSRAIDEERSRVCSLLMELDPMHASSYGQEIKDITKHLKIQDGLRDVNRSRVHVNVDAVFRWAERYIHSDYLRYMELLSAGIGFAGDDELAASLERFAEGDSSEIEKLMRYPEQEGDGLLIDIFDAVKREFLTNEDYGLDAYLSMRIRHGSLSGHLRGPLEEKSLIVPRRGDSQQYDDNNVWANVLNLSDSARTHLHSDFKTFSARYDKIIEDLTKERLQIRSSRKPAGMFFLSAHAYPLMVRAMRPQISPATTFPEFMNVLFSGIFTLLRVDLVAIRRHLFSTVKTDVETAFEELRANLEQHLTHDAYVTINSAFAEAIPAAAAAVGRVGEWFDLAREDRETSTWSISQIVDVGIEATRAAHKGFHPKVTTQIDDADIDVSVSEFTDILFTALDNVFVHSGNPRTPRVKIILAKDRRIDLPLLKFRIESEVAPQQHTPAAELKLARIRESLASSDYKKRANLEGGSGLLKLRRHASPDDSNAMTFGFVGTDMFFVELRVPILLSAAVRRLEDRLASVDN